MTTTAEQDTAQSEPLTVCLVDDDPMIGALFSRVIQRTGCRVMFACGFSEAKSMINEHKVDIVISDLMMPDFSDGKQLLGFVVKNYPNIPVFMMSGNMSPDTQDNLMQWGAKACLFKPFTTDVIKQLIVNLDQ